METILRSFRSSFQYFKFRTNFPIAWKSGRSGEFSKFCRKSGAKNFANFGRSSFFLFLNLKRGLKLKNFGIFLLPAVGWWKSSAGAGGDPKEIVKEKEIINKADTMYDSYLIDMLYNFLKSHKKSENAEILWRFGRVACEKAKLSKSKTEKQDLMTEGLQSIQRALEFGGENNFACHKWLAILLDYRIPLSTGSLSNKRSFLGVEYPRPIYLIQKRSQGVTREGGRGKEGRRKKEGGKGKEEGGRMEGGMREGRMLWELEPPPLNLKPPMFMFLSSSPFWLTLF